mmetsp:Transcript_15261/g.47627  ORF Transcript_15261/g.47627 Transcript_15261/m.47627 type:complete len:317 (-) Transcript_15261:230-1180(-)
MHMSPCNSPSFRLAERSAQKASAYTHSTSAMEKMASTVDSSTRPAPRRGRSKVVTSVCRWFPYDFSVASSSRNSRARRRARRYRRTASQRRTHACARASLANWSSDWSPLTHFCAQYDRIVRYSLLSVRRRELNPAVGRARTGPGDVGAAGADVVSSLETVDAVAGSVVAASALAAASARCSVATWSASVAFSVVSLLIDSVCAASAKARAAASACVASSRAVARSRCSCVTCWANNAFSAASFDTESLCAASNEARTSASSSRRFASLCILATSAASASRAATAARAAAASASLASTASLIRSSNSTIFRCISLC